MIKIAKNCGLSKINEQTLKLIYASYEKITNKDIVVYGSFIHNEIVKQELLKMHIKFTSDVYTLSQNDYVIITNTGIKKEDLNYLKKNKISYTDELMQEFKDLINLVKEEYANDYEIVFVSEDIFLYENLNSYFNNECLLVKDESDYYKLTKDKKKFLIYLDSACNKHILALENIFSYLEIKTYDFDYSKKGEIIKASQELAKECDVLLIIDNNNYLEEELKHLCVTYPLASLEDLINLILTNDFPKDTIFGLTASHNIPLKEINNYKYLLEFLLFYQEKYQELKKGQQAINEDLGNDNNSLVNKAIKDFQDLNQDGKYIRGVLIALGEYIANSKQNKYLNLAYAYEMFQTAILIHDDIIDNAKIRRGKETIPRRICHEYLNKKNDKEYQSDTLKLANSIGICMGDLGFYEAYKIINQNYHNHPQYYDILDLYNEIVIKTIKGEIIDVYLPFLGKYQYQDIQEEDIMEIYHLKTSYYTLIGPFMLGYLLGGKKRDEHLIKVLNNLGLSFQIKDDLLGIFGDFKTIGKSNTSDISEFKQTILYTHIIKTSYKEEFLKIYGKKIINNKDLKRIRELLIKSGSLDYALSYLHDLYDEAYLEIDKLKINNEGKDMLKGLLIYLDMRKK